jgi:hypothetical protein
MGKRIKYIQKQNILRNEQKFETFFSKESELFQLRVNFISNKFRRKLIENLEKFGRNLFVGKKEMREI